MRPSKRVSELYLDTPATHRKASKSPAVGTALGSCVTATDPVLLLIGDRVVTVVTHRNIVLLVAPDKDVIKLYILVAAIDTSCHAF